MITSLSFKKDFGWSQDKLIFKEGLEIALKPGVNILVGDQGSGKSTLIELLRARLEPDTSMLNTRMSQGISPSAARAALDVEGDGVDDLRVLALDFEKDTARSPAAFDFSGPIDCVSYLMAGKRASHGDANKMALNMLLGKTLDEYKASGVMPPTLILLDEPDAALSIASVMSLHLAIRNLATLGCQVVVSAHNPFLLGCFEELFSLEAQKWTSYSDYLSSQVTSRDVPGLAFATHYVPVSNALRGETGKGEGEKHG